MLRSILETSYGVFGIDLILFCSCIAIITKNDEVKKMSQFEILVIFFIVNLLLVLIYNYRHYLELLYF